jgi:hypothetical protein
MDGGTDGMWMAIGAAGTDFVDDGSGGARWSALRSSALRSFI